MNRKPFLIKGILLALLILPVVGVVVTLFARDRFATMRAAPLPMMGQVSRFSLIEASGKPVQESDLKGQVWLAAFIFTRCAGQCPLMTHSMALLQKQLPVREDLKLVSISVDPEHDTPEVLARYAASYEADRSHWLFLTGGKDAIRQLARTAFHLPVEDNAPSEGEPILHSTKLVLVDRDGLIRGYYDTTDAPSLKQLVRDVRRLLADRS